MYRSSAAAFPANPSNLVVNFVRNAVLGQHLPPPPHVVVVGRVHLVGKRLLNAVTMVPE